MAPRRGLEPPCYTRIDDLFVFSSHPLHLKEHLDFLVDKQPTILDHPEYRALQEVIPERASMISFGTWPDTIVAIYDTAAPLLNLLQGIPDLPAPLDVANLPSSRLLRRYAKGAVSYAVFDRGRLRMDVQGDGLSVLNPPGGPRRHRGCPGRHAPARPRRLARGGPPHPGPHQPQRVSCPRGGASSRPATPTRRNWPTACRAAS